MISFIIGLGILVLKVIAVFVAIILILAAIAIVWDLILAFARTYRERKK